MASYLTAYDLLKERGVFDYEPLWNELRRLGGHRTQLSLWLVNVPWTARELHHHLKYFIDGDDRLMVTELASNRDFSNAMSGTNAWLAEHTTRV